MENARHLTAARKAILLFALSVAAVALAPSDARAGNGTFRNGNFDFCVSVRFNATPAELQQIRAAFEEASQILADATDGQHRFGTITIINNDQSKSPGYAEYWVTPTTKDPRTGNDKGRAYATYGLYGKRGEHVSLFYPTTFTGGGPLGAAFTVAHEHAHHAYGVADEYKGSGGPAECAPPPDTAALNFCLMDNYFNRGGQFGSGTTYTLDEFCVAGNHDPDADTDQEQRNGMSCWEQIGAHPSRRATAPNGLPTGARPGAHTVTVEEGAAGLRVVLVLDHSGSMSSEQRLELAKQGAKQFVDFLQDGDQVGVVSFDDFASVNFPLTTISGSATKNAIKSSIDAITLGGSTNIGGGLQAALGQITSQSEHSCNNVVVLLSDGDHNTGTPPGSVIPALQDEHVAVLSVGLGSGISSSGQAALQQVASETGGKFFRVSGGADLVALFQQLSADTTGGGLLAHAPLALATGQVRETRVLVEPGVQNATFALALTDPSDDIKLSLRTPSGSVIDQSNAGANPNVEFFTDTHSRAFRVTSPAAGTWTLIATAGTVTDGAAVAQAFAEHSGVQFNLSVVEDVLSFPNAVELKATPRFGGESIVGALVTGFVRRPNGSTVAIALADDGSPATGDAKAGDGTYSARFNQYNGNGTYTFDLTAVVSKGVTYGGEEIFTFAASNEKPVTPFVRAGSTTAIVTGVPSIAGNADLSITKTVAPAGTVAAGAELVYTLNIANQGPDAATGVEVTDNLPLSTSFVSCASTGSGSCGGTGNNRLVTFATLASGDSATITLRARAGAGLPDDTTIANTATVASPVDDPNPANNLATATSTTRPAKLIRFAVASQSAGEGAGSAQVVVRRIGDLSGAASVAYATSNVTASDTRDYTISLGTLRFAAGEAEKRITVLLTDDVFVEGAETFRLTLSNPVGAALGTPSTNVLTLTDNDSAPGAPNPIDGTAFFVRQHYLDFLNREPDAAGLAFWSSGIDRCGPDVQCREAKRVDTSAAFFLSIEFQETGYLVYRAYKSAFGDTTSPNVGVPVPVVRLRELFAGAQAIGRGVRVGIGDWERQLEANKQAFALEFVQQPRFLAAHPLTLSPAQFVDRLNTNAGNVLSASERNQLVTELTAAADAAQGRASVLRKVAEDADLRRNETNRAFVLMQYYGYLRRNPNDPQDTDFRGWAFWLNKLNAFNGDYVRAEMVKAFLVSIEYRRRFGQ